jgi:integrase
VHTLQKRVQTGSEHRRANWIQLRLGHASIQTTERYLGTRQNLRDAPNDRLGRVARPPELVTC